MMRCTLSSCRRSSICKASTRRDARWCTSSSLVTSPPSATSMSSSATSSTSSTTPAPGCGQDKKSLRLWGTFGVGGTRIATSEHMWRRWISWQSCYPERLGRVLLIHVPYVIMAAWKMLYPFIDDKTKEKFVFVAGSWDLDATLRDSIDESQLPKEYGGRLELRGYNDLSPPSSSN
ncbi:hypothetical protein VPH35_100564 [Triticum aestivum]